MNNKNNSKKRILFATFCLIILASVGAVACNKVNQGKAQGKTMKKIQLVAADSRVFETELPSDLEAAEELKADNNGFEFPEEETLSIDKYTGIKSGRKVYSTVIPYDGVARSITCWGDSLTEGWIETSGNSGYIINGISNASETKSLSYYTGIPVYNMGVWGEDSRQIACRQGGLKMYVKNITIPSSGCVYFPEVMCEDGKSVIIAMRENAAQRACFDSCTLGGVTGQLIYDYSEEQYMFLRLVDGEEVTLQIAELATATSVARSGDILVLEMGNNGGWSGSLNKLIEQYDSMINYSGCDYYIIVGDTDGFSRDNPFLDDWGYRADWNRALKDAFGDHFLDMRQYLADNGMTDCGLTPTEDDLSYMEYGGVPNSLKSDWSHLNEYGYWSRGKALYLKGVELGYWGTSGRADEPIKKNDDQETSKITEASTEASTEESTQAKELTTEATKPLFEVTTAATSGKVQ